MTELSFLIDLLLNHELSKQTKDKIASRISEVEGDLLSRIQAPPVQQSYTNNPVAVVQKQAASTLAAMAKHGDISGMVSAPDMPPVEPVAIVAQTPLTAMAVQSSNAIRGGAKPPMTSEGRPRKF